MKKLLLILFALTASLAAQNYNFNIGGLQYASGRSVPGSCNRAGSYFFKNSATTTWYVCQGGVYVAVASSAGATSPGGSDTNLQYNNAASFGGIGNGTSGWVLTSNGSGSVPSFQAASGGGVLLSATVTLTAAQIKALAQGESTTNPVELVAAPGAGKVNLLTALCLDYKFGTQAYVANGPGLQIIYGGGTTFLFNDSETTPFITAAASRLVLGALVSNAPDITDFYGLRNVARTEAANKAIHLISQPGHSFDAGPIVTPSVAAKGTGYAVNDTGIIDPGLFLSSGDATYRVASVDGSGGVTGIVVTALGTIYPVSHGFHYATDTDGGGSGLTINVDTVTAGDGTLAVTVYYTVVTLTE